MYVQLTKDTMDKILKAIAILAASRQGFGTDTSTLIVAKKYYDFMRTDPLSPPSEPPKESP